MAKRTQPTLLAQGKLRTSGGDQRPWRVRLYPPAPGTNKYQVMFRAPAGDGEPWKRVLRRAVHGAGLLAGVISDAPAKENAWVEVKHLLAAGLLEAGTVLFPRPGQWEGVEATVLPDGQISVDGKAYSSPSSAGYHAKGGRATNGWTFWQLADGRRLADVRAQYRGDKADKPAGFDWSRLHEILAALPAGTWTSYSDLADAIGTAPQPLGTHITRCQQCSYPWRVLTSDGRIAAGFAWSDPNDDRKPANLLAEEGVQLVDGVADRDQRLDSEALAMLIEDAD